VASSVTRFDIPKINSPADPPRGPPNELDDEGGGPGREGDKKRGNRTRVFSFRQSLSLSLSLSLSVFRRDHEAPRERGP